MSPNSVVTPLATPSKATSLSWRELTSIVLLSVLFGSASLIGLGSAKVPIDPMFVRLRYIAVAVSLALILLLSPMPTRWRLYKRVFPLVLSWLLFSFASLLAALANADAQLLLGSMWFLAGVPLLFFNVLPRVTGKRPSVLIAVALLLGHVPYVLISFWQYPAISFPYGGVHPSTNQMGITGVMLATGAWVLLSVAVNSRQSTWLALFLCALLGSTLGLIVLSGSRTSLAVFLALLCVFALSLISRPQKLVQVSILLVTMAIVLLPFAGEEMRTLWNSMQRKFEIELGKGDLLSGRSYIWAETLSNVNLFGHGSGYFEAKFGLGAHNSIIQVLGESGIAATLAIVYFSIASIVYAYQYAKQNRLKKPDAFAPLIIITSLWALSLGETMFGLIGRGITLACLLSVGILINEPPPQRQANQQKPS